MELLTAIATRCSAARLDFPAPTPEHLAQILDAAGRAPDHGRLRPWQLAVLEGEARERFASAAASAKRARVPSMSDEQFSAERAKLMRSPSIVVVGCRIHRQTKIPEIEQVVAAGAAAQNLFLAAHDLGYGVMWKTGAAAYDAAVKHAVGLAADDHIVGIMHLGTRV